MPIIIRRGDLLKSEAAALVNTVNCVGVMGKGVALAFRNRFGDALMRPYQAACRNGTLRPGTIQIVPIDGKLVVNFPTKLHWRNPSEIQWVRDGLQALVREIRARGIASIAIPPLGCGNGGLRWSDVEPLIVEALGGIDGLAVEIYPPA